MQGWASPDCRYNLGRSTQFKVHGASHALLGDLNDQARTDVVVVVVVMVVTNRQQGRNLDAVRSCDGPFDMCEPHPWHSRRSPMRTHVQTPEQTQSLQAAPKINRKASPSADSLIGSLEEWSSGLTAGYAYPFSSMRWSTAGRF